MDPLSITASTAGLLALGGAVISKGYCYVASVRAFPKDLECLLSETAALNQTLTQLVGISYAQPEGRTKNTALQALGESGSLEQCKKSLESLEALLAACEKHHGENLKNLRKAAFWPFHSKEVNKILLSIQRLQQVFQSALAVDNASALLRLEEQLKALSISYTDDLSQLTTLGWNMLSVEESNRESISRLNSDNQGAQRLKLLSWLSSMDPWPKHHNLTSLREPQTGMWLFNEPVFKDWKDKGPLLWIYGSSGMGKTVLTSSIINKLHEDRQHHNDCKDTVAFHYCDFGAGDSLRAISVLRSILRQVVVQQHEILRSVQEAYGSSSGQEKLSIQAILGYLIDIAEVAPGKLYIIVDGIDESDERMDLLKAFQKLSGSAAAAAFRILILSRPLYDIQQVVSDPKLGLGTDKVAVDIEFYVKSEIKKHEKLSRIPNELQASIESTLCSGARGMFRWVKCQFDVLKKARTPADVSRTLREMPPGLDETYDKILRNISECDRERVRRALYWIINADPPLHLNELAEAVAIDPNQVDFNKSMRLCVTEDLLEMCGSLVQLTSEKIVALDHYSVQEYLLSPRLASKDVFISCFAVDLSKHLMTSSLLTYNFFIALDVARTSMPESLISFRHRFPLVEYIHQSWFNPRLEDYTTSYNWFDKFFSTRDPHEAISRLDDVWFKDCTNLNCQDGPYLVIVAGIAEFLQKNLLSFLDQLLDSKIPDDGQKQNHVHGTLEVIRKSQDRWEEDLQQPIRGRNWYSPLQAAAMFGYDRVVRFLLSNDACVNGVERPGSYRAAAPIHYAVWGNHEKVLRTLIDHGADPNYRITSQHQFTGLIPCLTLALTRSPKLFNILLKSGADPNAYDFMGYNYHHWKLHDSEIIFHLRGTPDVAAKLDSTGCTLPNLSLRQYNVIRMLQMLKSGLLTSRYLRGGIPQLFGLNVGGTWLSQVLHYDGFDEYAVVFMEQKIVLQQDGILEHSASCDECDPEWYQSGDHGTLLKGLRYKCLDCIDVDLCAPCYERVMSGKFDLRSDFLQICRGHKWLKVPRDCWYDFPEGVVTESGQSVMEVVDDLLVRYSSITWDEDEDDAPMGGTGLQA